MFKFLRNLFSLKHIRQRAFSLRKTTGENRRHVGQNIFFLSLVVFMAIVLRLTWLVATNNVAGVNLSKAAKNNYTYTETVYPTRGTIYDRTGVPIAVDSSTYTIYVNLDPASVDASGKKLYAQKSEYSKLENFLNSELGISKTLASSQLNRKGAKQVQFGVKGTNISLEKEEKITDDAQKQGIIGIGFTANLARSYPNGIFASNFIGISQIKTPGDSGSGLVGINGIEASLNSILAGKAGTETLEKTSSGVAIPGAIISEKKPVNGSNVYTTLDANLQTYLEQLIDSAYTSSGAEQVSAVLMEAKTGEILATSQRPTFNPQDMSGTTQKYFTWNDLLYQSAYEPGSVMKTFLVAAAMNQGDWYPQKTAERKLTYYGTTIQDWDLTELGQANASMTMTYAQGFAYSSNTIMAQLQISMGSKIWDNYLGRFDFGYPVRWGIGNEVEGTLPSSNLIAQATSAFGQGIAVSELQMLRGWTSLAGNGTMLEPQFISNIVNPNNMTTLYSKPEVIGHPVSSSSASDIRNLMISVDTLPGYGTAYDDTNATPYFLINGQAPAVKTGTANIASATGGYLTGKNDVLRSAVVMYPAQDPDFVFYMVERIPTDQSMGIIASVADPLIERAESLKATLDNTKLALPNGQVTVGNYFGQQPGNVEDVLRRETLHVSLVGSGNKVTAQSIPSGTNVDANTKILLLTDGTTTMPDIYGWSKKNVDQLAKWYNITVEYKGGGDNHDSGTVTSQSISSSTVVKAGQKLTVTLSGD